MAKLHEIIKEHLIRHGLSAKAFAERTGIGYPTLIGALNTGRVPRKAEHREKLRQALGLDQDVWAEVLAASGGVELPSDGPLNLQQMVTKALYAQGHTEQSFARTSGIPYPTILGITRKGAVPRTDTLPRLAAALGLDEREVQDAALASKAQRRADQPGTEPMAREDDDGDDVPTLAQLVADHVAERRVSIANFARATGLPYLSLIRLINTGVPPRENAVLDALARVLGLDDERFQASLSRSRRNPEPAVARTQEPQGSPFQQALRELMTRKQMTVKAFAQASGLSVLTATRLVKHGALPSRTTTHAKIRSLLGLADEAYGDLLVRSRLPEAAGRPAAADEDEEAGDGGTDEFPHHDTDEIPGEAPREALSPKGALPEPASRATAEPMPDEEMLEIIGRLSLRQKQALKAFLLSLL